LRHLGLLPDGHSRAACRAGRNQDIFARGFECPLSGVRADVAVKVRHMTHSGLVLPHAIDSLRTKILPILCRAVCEGAPVEIARNIIPIDYATAVRDYARGNLDEAELWVGLTALGYNSFEIEWHIANPGRRMSRGVANG
jgi:hypothetical protein